MRWTNPGLVWDQFYLTPDLYYGQSLPPAEIERLAALLEQARREAGLPAAVEAQVQHGSAVHLFNAAQADVPVGIALTALEHDLVDPSVGWDGGRIVWRGRLKPGERLDIAGTGRVRVTAADGAARDAGGNLEGAAPTLAAGRSDVFHFWHAGPQRDARFKAALRYGPDGEPQPDGAKQNIHARRLAWVRDPYLVFQPITGLTNQRGLFADAHVVHQHLGRVPECRAVRADALPADVDDPVWRDIPAVELVRGREGGGGAYERNGFPADRRTRVQFVHARQGLAVRILADGAPVDREKLILRLNDKALEFAVAAKPVAGPAVCQLKIDPAGWRGLAIVAWSELGLAEDAVPAEMSAQILRERGADRYLWSPPLGTAWGEKKQGPGKLLLANPSRSRPPAVNGCITRDTWTTPPRLAPKSKSLSVCRQKSAL